MDLNLATWIAITEAFELAVVKTGVEEEPRGMNRRGPAPPRASSSLLPNTRTGPAPPTCKAYSSLLPNTRTGPPPPTCKAYSSLLPNTRAMLQRMFSRGPFSPTSSSNQANRSGPTLHTTASVTMLTNPKSVLKKTVTPEELQQPSGLYRKKLLRIESDGLGWGFVVRGTGPCHIQAVEPLGPAAVAGMKVCQLVVSINKQSVLEMDYKSVNHLILTGPRKMQMEVMEV